MPEIGASLASAEKPRMSPKRVLLVDEDPASRRLTRKFFENKQGYNLTHVISLREADELVSQRRRADAYFDLIIIDLANFDQRDDVMNFAREIQDGQFGDPYVVVTAAEPRLVTDAYSTEDRARLGVHYVTNKLGEKATLEALLRHAEEFRQTRRHVVPK